jgi:hypothetical protein
MSPLANQNPLDKLNDIIAPIAPSWWPPAPIYWFLSLAVIILLIATFYLFRNLKKMQLTQQRPLLELQHLKESNANFIELNQLLKGVALLYFPRHQVASLHGPLWFDFLQSYSARPIFGKQATFIARLYNNVEQLCSAEDITQAKAWIIELPKQIKKQQKESNKNV